MKLLQRKFIYHVVKKMTVLSLLLFVFGSILSQTKENKDSCIIQSNQLESKKGISIILNNACKWSKTEGGSELNLISKSTSSTLTIAISDRDDEMSDLNKVSSEELLKIKDVIIKGIIKKDTILASDVVTLNKKKYIYFSAKSKNKNDHILTECYYCVVNNRFIMILLLAKDEDEANLKSRFKKAQNDLKDLLSRIAIIGNESENPNEYFNKGLIKAQNNDIKGAIADFTIAIKLNPKLAEAYYNRGNAKFRLQDNKGAIEDFNKSIVINPKLPQAYYNRGTVKMKLQDYNEALLDFDKAIDLQSDFADAYLNRGLMKIVLGTKEGGCVDLNKARTFGSLKADKAINMYCK